MEMASQESVHRHQDVSWLGFGAFFQGLRQRIGLSQERMAHLLHCDRTYVWKLEHSRHRPSRIFLHNLQQTCALTAEENATLRAFVLLRSYGDNLNPE